MVVGEVVHDAVSTDVRPVGVCPLCGHPSQVLDSFRFSRKSDLPTSLRFDACRRCNFLFAGDVSESAYRRHYAAVRNDGGHVVVSDAADCQCELQAAHLAAVLPPSFAGDVLDLGCGTGQLLRTLANSLPQARLFGHDVANYLPVHPTIRFVDSIDDTAVRYDVVVLSHVLEHLVGFAMMGRLEAMLRPGGVVYVELPNPFEYHACHRREFMYYFDRLHLNHFGDRAVRRLLGRYGLQAIDGGTHRFRYRDGHYPAAWWLASRVVDAVPFDRAVMRPIVTEAPLDAVYRAYRVDEGQRAMQTRRRITEAARDGGVLVYGAGDNFRRARWADGPLFDVPVVAVLDRNASQLSLEDGLPVETPEAGLARHPDVPVVVTVSQDSEAVAAGIRERSPDREVLFV